MKKARRSKILAKLGIIGAMYTSIFFLFTFAHVWTLIMFCIIALLFISFFTIAILKIPISNIGSFAFYFLLIIPFVSGGFGIYTEFALNSSHTYYNVPDEYRDDVDTFLTTFDFEHALLWNGTTPVIDRYGEYFSLELMDRELRYIQTHFPIELPFWYNVTILNVTCIISTSTSILIENVTYPHDSIEHVSWETSINGSNPDFLYFFEWWTNDALFPMNQTLSLPAFYGLMVRIEYISANYLLAGNGVDYNIYAFLSISGEPLFVFSKLDWPYYTMFEK